MKHQPPIREDMPDTPRLTSRGVTLVEVMMVLGVLAFLLGIVMQIFASVQTSSKSSELLTEIMTVHNIAKMYSVNNPDSGCCDTKEIYSSGDLPKKWYDSKNQTLVTPSGGIIDPHTGANNYLVIWIRGLTIDQCRTLATTTWGADQHNLNINGLGDYGSGTWPGGQAAQWCAKEPEGQAFVAIGWDLSK